MLSEEKRRPLVRLDPGEIIYEVIRLMLSSDEPLKAIEASKCKLDRLSSIEFVIGCETNMNHADANVRLLAAFLALEAIGDHSKATETIGKFLLSNHINDIFNAMVYLSRLNSVPGDLNTRLDRLFESGDWPIRVYAAACLRDHRPDTLPVLTAALRGDDPVLAMTAACALGRLRIRSEEVAGAMADVLAKAEPDFAMFIVYQLALMGPAAAVAVPALIKLAAEPSTAGELRRAVIRTLGTVGGAPSAREKVIPALTRTTRSKDWAAACIAAVALKEAGEVSLKAVHNLIGLLGSDDPAARSAVALSLGEFGAMAAEAVPCLIDRAKVEQDRDVMWSFVSALVSIGVPAVPALIDWLAEADLRESPVAISALSRIGFGGAELVASALLTHTDTRVRGFAAAVFLKMGPAAAPAVPFILRLLETGDEEDRFNAVATLGSIGPEARDGVPALIRILGGENRLLGEYAAKALVQIGSEAIPDLEQAFADADVVSRDRIQKLLEHFGRRGGPRSSSPDFSWVGDDALLELFVHVGRILEKGPLGGRRIAKHLSVLKAQGRTRFEIPAAPHHIAKWLRRLEDKLSKREDTSVRLTTQEASSRRAGKLSKYGEELLPKIALYLESLYY